MKNKINIQLLLFVFLSLIFTSTARAEGGPDLEVVVKYSLGFTVLLILLLVWLVVVYSERNDFSGEEFWAPFKKVKYYLTLTTPPEKEKDLLMDHEYDGIRELDSRIPPWFHGLLWFTVIFSIVYMIQYHVIGSGNVQEEEYLAEISFAKAERQILIKTGAFLNEETVTFTDDVGALENGKQIYLKNCASCHANDGGGLVGPNFTDKYWIHGGSIKNLFTTIKYGVPQKGMISWSNQLDPIQMRDVASYILTLQGTEPANPKAPEGTLYIPETEKEQKTDSET